MLLWGPPGCGKTTLAASAPGDKLWLSFGESEHLSVSSRPDVFVMNLANTPYDEVFKHGLGSSPFGLDAELYERKNIKTVVVDNLTVVQYLGLQKAVADGVGASRSFQPTMQSPGLGAYGGRNQNLIAIMKALLMVTGKHGCHIIFTAHEEDPVTRVDGTIEFITMSLGGKLINNVTSALSEIWNYRQETGGKRQRIITTRVSGNRRPMKTRMFSQMGESSFAVNYDPEQPINAQGQMSISSIWEQWLKSGMKRIPVPSTRRGGDLEDNKVIKLRDSPL